MDARHRAVAGPGEHGGPGGRRGRSQVSFQSEAPVTFAPPAGGGEMRAVRRMRRGAWFAILAAVVAVGAAGCGSSSSSGDSSGGATGPIATKKSTVQLPGPQQAVPRQTGGSKK